MLRAALAILALSALVACGGEGQQRGIATPEEVAKARYQGSGPPSLTLYTMLNNRTGAGGHTALLVNASQRVIFDPAGSFHYPTTPRRGDVLFGMSPKMSAAYESMHARETHHVVAQTILVPADVAEKALQLVLANGAVPQTQCASSTSAILGQLPGIEGLGQTLYPDNLMRRFAKVRGVTERKLYEDFDPTKAVAE